MVTFRGQVEEARSILSQYTTNRPILGTFTGWVGDSPNFTGITLSAVPNKLSNAVVELGHELVHVSTYDPSTGATACPPWFRQQQGSPANSGYAANSVAVINPQWPYHAVAKNVINGIANLYPTLFQVKTVQVTTALVREKYLLPADVDEIVMIKYQDVGPVQREREVSRWSIDHLAIDGNRYLHINEVALAGRPVYVTYRCKPVLPTVTADSDWSATGLPDTAADLPPLWAAVQMLPSADAAKTQTMSVEQSDRNKYVQPGAANAASRRLQDIYQARLMEEKRKLQDRFPPKLHRNVNG